MEKNEQQQQSFWQFSDQLRDIHTPPPSLDSIWSNNYMSKRPVNEAMRRNFDIKVGGEINNSNFGSSGKPPVSDYSGSVFNNMLGGGEVVLNLNGAFNKGIYSKPSSCYGNFNLKGEDDEQLLVHPKSSLKKKKKNKKNESISANKNNNNDVKMGMDKRFKTLTASECLPRNESIGGYIFVCNNDTMAENLKRQLFGLPPRYRDSVRTITPGLPLFLYNYTTHQLHGIFEAASFGGSNIDPSAWEDKKCVGESRFPAQVRVITRKIYEPLEEDSFRPILHHYDGPKFRLELNIPEALSLLDIFAQQDNFNDPVLKATPP